MHFDGNPFDMATILVAIFTCFIRPIRRRLKKDNKASCFAFRDVVVDFLNGTVIVPFAILIGSIFSSELLAETLKSSKMFMAIGGIIGLLFVAREYFNGD